jgi:hypothetical protein
MTENPGNQAQAEAMLAQLAGSVALLPQDLPDDAERPPEGGIALLVIEQDDTQFVPVFSTEEKLVASGADPAQAVTIPLAQLAAGWPDEELWLAVDPGDEDGLALPPDVVRALPTFAAG